MSKGVDFPDAAGPEGMRLYAIGDVHGRLDLLEAMFARIDAQISVTAPTDWRIILLGDYVDRGPDSKGVLDFLEARQTIDPHMILLCGNHDAGFLEFLDHPTSDALFARHGGRETARSYGVDADFGSDRSAKAARDALRMAVPQRHLEMLAGLQRSVTFGDFFFCHAGIRPGVALEAQDESDLIWIRGDFLNHAGLHPKIVVHGHTPCDTPEVMPNRVNIDTRAFATGRLTALSIDGAVKELIMVEEPASSAWR